MDRTYKRIKLFIDDVDITDSWSMINIYQSIDAPTWSCDITIIDGTNLLETIPINHGSAIKITVETEDQCATDGTNDFEFNIFNISNKISANQNMETYVIKGVSKAFLLNNTIRLNSAYSSRKMTDIIKDISDRSFSDMSTKIKVDSDNSGDMLLNNWDPFTSIAWVLKQAHHNSRADFMYFQTDNKEFTVDSIDSMYSDSANRIDEIVTYKVENTGDKNKYNIIKHEWNHVDVQQNLQSGYYKSKTISYDFFTKTSSVSTYTHGDDSKDDLKIAPAWKDALFDSAENASITFIPKASSSFNSSTGYDDAEKWVPSRRATLQRLDSERFSAQLRGSVGVYKWLGKNIYIDLPNNNSASSDFYSRFRKGQYLITAIVHHITPSMYINNFEFVKMRVEE